MATPGSHSNVRARDSVDTRSHLSAVYTFGLDLLARGDRLSPSKKGSKQTRAGGRRGGRINGGRETRPEPSV